MTGQREHANQPTCSLVTCSLHKNHLGMNFAINSCQGAQQGHLFLSFFQFFDSGFPAVMVLYLLVCKRDNRVCLEIMPDPKCPQ